jgi:2-polyprenyl-3-methyl-5-hydroxy-6-metoxy-1,4-benzoquinol methylase
LDTAGIKPKDICEVGCGAGEILTKLQEKLPKDCLFWGYDISSKAIQICLNKANNKLKFAKIDFLKEKTPHFDLILLIDLIEHLDDYHYFLKKIKARSKYKILHIPLEVSVQAILRQKPFW